MKEKALSGLLPDRNMIVWRLVRAVFVLGATVLLAQWGWSAYRAGDLPGPTLVWVCMAVSVLQLAWYLLAAKAELNNRVVWEGRDAAFTALVMCSASVLLLVVAVLTGGPQITTHVLSWRSGFWIPVLGTGGLNIIIQYAKVRAKALEDVSLVGPIESTTPAIVIVVGMIMLGEYPGLGGWAGIWLVALGTYSLQIADLFEKLSSASVPETSLAIEGVASRWRSRWYYVTVFLAPITALRQSRGVRWAFLAVLFSCVTLNYDALIARNANVSFASACVFGIAGMGNLAWAAYRRQFSGLDLWYVAQALALLVVLFAMLHVVLNVAFRAALMSHVGALKRLAIPLTILGAFFFLSERKKFGGRLIGGALMAVGAILIGLDM